jgi:hypothetical protein
LKKKGTRVTVWPLGVAEPPPRPRGPPPVKKKKNTGVAKPPPYFKNKAVVRPPLFLFLKKFKILFLDLKILK